MHRCKNWGRTTLQTSCRSCYFHVWSGTGDDEGTRGFIGSTNWMSESTWLHGSSHDWMTVILQQPIAVLRASRSFIFTTHLLSLQLRVSDPEIWWIRPEKAVGRDHPFLKSILLCVSFFAELTFLFHNYVSQSKFPARMTTKLHFLFLSILSIPFSQLIQKWPLFWCTQSTIHKCLTAYYYLILDMVRITIYRWNKAYAPQMLRCSCCLSSFTDNSCQTLSTLNEQIVKY